MAKATKRDTEAVAKCRDVVEGLMGEFLQVSFHVMLCAMQHFTRAPAIVIQVSLPGAAEVPHSAGSLPCLAHRVGHGQQQTGGLLFCSLT